MRHSASNRFQAAVAATDCVESLRNRRLERVDDVRSTQDFGTPMEMAVLFG